MTPLITLPDCSPLIEALSNLGTAHFILPISRPRPQGSSIKINRDNSSLDAGTDPADDVYTPYHGFYQLLP